jgi:hypothetical protein
MPELPKRGLRMVKIVFRNTSKEVKPESKVFRASGVRMASDCIYGVINGNEVPLATGTGSLWKVGDRLFNNVEIQSVNIKLVGDDDRKVA